MVNEDRKVQVLIRVPKSVKQLAQQEADLAHEYGWISTPTVTQLFIWTVNYYLAKGIKDFIKQRREGKQAPTKKEGTNG